MIFWMRQLTWLVGFLGDSAQTTHVHFHKQIVHQPNPTTTQRSPSMATIKLSSSKSANNSLSYCAKKSTITTGLHCNPTIAKTQFAATRNLWNKQGGRQVHTIIQSFKPGEISPAKANEIGIKLAEKLITGHEVVIYTHTDTNHIHNHIVLNAVNFETGKKYHPTPEDIYKAREASDNLCKAYGLSIATDTPAPLRYTLAESEIIAKGMPGWKQDIRQAIDTEKTAVIEEVLGKHGTQQETLKNLAKNLVKIPINPTTQSTEHLALLPTHQQNYDPHTTQTLNFILSEAYNKLKQNLLAKYGILVNDSKKHITFRHPDGQVDGQTHQHTTLSTKPNPNTKKLVRGKTLGEDYDRLGIQKSLQKAIQTTLEVFIQVNLEPSTQTTHKSLGWSNEQREEQDHNILNTQTTLQPSIQTTPKQDANKNPQERTLHEIPTIHRQGQQYQGTNTPKQYRTPDNILPTPNKHNSIRHDEGIIRDIQNRSRELPPQNSLDTIQRELRRIDKAVLALTSTGRAEQAERKPREQTSSNPDERQHHPNDKRKQNPNTNLKPEQPEIPKPSPRHYGGFER